MSLTDWPARAGTVALLWLALIQNPEAAVYVEDVTGNPLDEVTVGLFIDGLRLDSVPGPFDLNATFTFDSNLTLISVAAGPHAGLASIYWPPFFTAPNAIGFNSIFMTDPGPFMNAEILRLTFEIGAGAGPGPFSIAVTENYTGASIVPLPPALVLCTGALAALSMFRRRT
tara:strand:- start:5770 stop:6282 length:513 start_codon:yes stop_codon:yes gene_type:complete